MVESEEGAAEAAEVGGLGGGAGEEAEAVVEEGAAAAAAVSGCEGGGASMLFGELPAVPRERAVYSLRVNVYSDNKDT
jgi:hypothetical protein